MNKDVKTIISFAVLLFISLSTVIFSNVFLKKSTAEFKTNLEYISSYTENNNWESAKERYNILNNMWIKKRKQWSFFIPKNNIVQMDMLLAKLENSILQKSTVESVLTSSEILSGIDEMVDYTKLSLENIF